MPSIKKGIITKMEENKEFASEIAPSSELPAENKTLEENEISKDGTSEESKTGEETKKTDSQAEKNYGEIMQRDIEELHQIFPHIRDKKSILELDNPLRYAALRDLGLSPKEAYLASSNIGTAYDNRSHITSSAPRGASASSEMLSSSELEAARTIFSDLSDREIQKLYKKVTK